MTTPWEPRARQRETESRNRGTEAELTPTFSLPHDEEFGLAHEIKHPNTFVVSQPLLAQLCNLVAHPVGLTRLMIEGVTDGTEARGDTQFAVDGCQVSVDRPRRDA